MAPPERPHAALPNQSPDLVLLFARLTWPAPLVRERACTALAQLIVHAHWGEVVRTHFAQWMAKQELESVVAIGVLVLVRATMFGLPADEAHRLAAPMTKPSLLSWLLLQEISPQATPPLQHVLVHAGTAPSDYTPDAFFEDHVRAFLPVAYADRAEFIERERGIAFRRQWAYEWARLVERVGIERSTQPLREWSSPRSGRVRSVVADTAMSEVYRSAYLRALAWAVTTHNLSIGITRFFAAMTCPIDLDLWRLTPLPRPAWWPRLATSNGDLDIAPAEVWAQVTALWQEQASSNDFGLGAEHVLLQASGRVSAVLKRSEDELPHSPLSYDLDICGIFQKCHGPNEPALEEIVSWYCAENVRDNNGLTVQTPSLLRLAGPLQKKPPDERVWLFDDWSVVPAASQVHSWGAVPRWQGWRLRRGIWLPTPYLTPAQAECTVNDDGVGVTAADQILGTWRDWTDGIEERPVDDTPSAAGEYVVAPREIIDQFMASTRSTFCWICRLTAYIQKDRHTESEQFTDVRAFGASHLVHS